MIPMSESLPERDAQRLDDLYYSLKSHTETFLGYPCSLDFDYSDLFRFLDFPINNVGDPFGPGTYSLHTRVIERDVIAFFADLLQAPERGYWGYVTNGGTEGNLYGLYLARELLPDGIVYYSEDTHYSVSKNLRLLRMRNIMIRSRPNGDFDYDDLRETMSVHRDVPPVVFANIGTTMREGHSDLEKIQEIFKDLAIHQHYVHCDAALCGVTLPFIEGSPQFDFAAGADSIAISGHKFIGAPIPCGVVLARKEAVDRIARSIEYVGALDTTIPGSRNGFSVLMLWHAIQRLGLDGLRKLVQRCIGVAEYGVHALKRHGFEAWRNPHAITIVLPRPSEHMRKRWQLAVQDDIAHIVALPHVDEAAIDRFIVELVADREQREQEESPRQEESSR